MAKNPFGKTVTRDKAYAVYADEAAGWTWYVLKVNQGPDSKKGQYASAFCLVTSPIVGDSGEYGDTYLSDIGGVLINGVDVRAGKVT